MSLEGMDVEQATRIAQQFDGYERELRNIAGAIASLTNELSYRWRGPASAMFAQQAPGYQAMIAGAANAIAEMRARLIANIAQQEQASAATGGSGASAIAGGAAISGAGLTALLGGLGGVGAAWNAVDKGSGYLSFLTAPVDAIEGVAGHDINLPILHQLHDSKFVTDMAKLANGPHISVLRDGLDKAGWVVGAASVGVSAGQVGYNLANGRYASAAGDSVDVVADSLKTFGAKDPVAYLAGVDISLFKKDFDLATQIKWSEGLPNPFSHNNFRTVYLPEFKALPGQVVEALNGVF